MSNVSYSQIVNGLCLLDQILYCRSQDLVWSLCWSYFDNSRSVNAYEIGLAPNDMLVGLNLQRLCQFDNWQLAMLVL